MIHSTEHIDPHHTPEQRLFGKVILQSILDATAPRQISHESEAVMNLASIQADRWLRNGGSDFVDVCSRAGIDPDWLREKYVSGAINRDMINGKRGQRGRADRRNGK